MGGVLAVLLDGGAVLVKRTMRSLFFRCGGNHSLS